MCRSLKQRRSSARRASSADHGNPPGFGRGGSLSISIEPRRNRVLSGGRLQVLGLPIAVQFNRGIDLSESCSKHLAWLSEASESGLLRLLRRLNEGGSSSSSGSKNRKRLQDHPGLLPVGRERDHTIDFIANRSNSSAQPRRIRWQLRSKKAFDVGKSSSGGCGRYKIRIRTSVKSQRVRAVCG